MIVDDCTASAVVCFGKCWDGAMQVHVSLGVLDVLRSVRMLYACVLCL